MNMQKNRWEAPTIPVAEADGLIKISDLNTDVIVKFPLWEGASPGDRYGLELNGASISTGVLVSPLQSSGELVSLKIPPERLAEDGVHAVTCFGIVLENGVVLRSLPTLIRVDLTQPGSALIGPMLFANINYGEVLVGRVSAFFGMEPGDLIQTLCNNTEGPTFLVQPENLTTTPIEIRFTKDFLESLQSDKVTLTYHVTDRAGNRSILAQSVDLTLAL